MLPQAHQQPTGFVSVFDSTAAFEEAQRTIKAIIMSDLVPPMYRGDTPKGFANALIALDIARQCKTSVLTVMQNLQIVEGIPNWKSSYLIERITQAGFTVEYEVESMGVQKVAYTTWTGSKAAGTRRAEKTTVEVENLRCRFVATKDGNKTYGIWVSVEMAIQEGWYFRNGSKWQTMTDKMLRYAAAREFNRFYPVVPLNNIPTEESIADWEDFEPAPDNLAALNEKAAPKPPKQKAEPKPTPPIEEAEVETDGDDEDMI